MTKKKTYLIEKEDGTRMKVTVPEEWKVTFGPAAKGVNSGSGPRLKMPMALRFYESETKQRAIFTDVIGFRDTSIPIEVEKTDVQEKDGFTEVDGVRNRSTFQVKTKKWVDPDKVIDTNNILEDLRKDD
jgi:hypothetical protein